MDEENDLDNPEDSYEEMQENNMDMNEDFVEGYGYPTPEARHNKHTFIHKAAFETSDTLKTTFLDKNEIGMPLLSIRFMLDLQKYAHHLDLPKLEEYWKEKIRSVTDSGMSNQGFAMNLNVTDKRDVSRKKLSGNINNLKQGKKEVKN